MTTDGFELLREQDIPELNTRARLYRHAKTGAELLSLENDDENKVFGITFRTPPAPFSLRPMTKLPSSRSTAWANGPPPA